jgi:hypothetical protein
MGDVSGFGRALVVLGAILIVLGGLLWRFGRVPLLGRLPGDIIFHKGHTTVYIPIVTSILLSLILTVILALMFRRS